MVGDFSSKGWRGWWSVKDSLGQVEKGMPGVGGCRDGWSGSVEYQWWVEHELQGMSCRGGWSLGWVKSGMKRLGVGVREGGYAWLGGG